jgi:hypothetical protein
MKDFITELYSHALRKKKNLNIQVFKRLLKMKYKINIETDLIKKRINEKNISNY